MVEQLVHDGWAVAAAMLSAILAIGIALAFVEAQWGAISGRANLMAEAFDKIAFLAACVLVIAAATLSANLLQSSLSAAMSGSREGLAQAFVAIGTLVANIVIVVASLLITLGILGGSIAGQFFASIGQAHGVSEAMARIVGAVVFGVAALLTLPIARLIIASIGNAIR